MSKLPNVGQRIAKRRAELGMDQGELAAATKLSQSVICRIEYGKQRLRLEHLPAFAKALQCSLAELLGEKPFRKEPKIAANG